MKLLLRALSRARTFALVFCAMAVLVTVVQASPAIAAEERVDEHQQVDRTERLDQRVATASAVRALATNTKVETLPNGGLTVGSQPVTLNTTSFPMGETFVYDLHVEANTAFRDEQGNRLTPDGQNNEIPRHQRKADLVRSTTDAKVEITAVTAAAAAGGGSDTCVSSPDSNPDSRYIRMDLGGATVAAIELTSSASVVNTVYVYSPAGNTKRSYTVDGNRVVLDKTYTDVRTVFVYMDSGSTASLVGYCSSLSPGGSSSSGAQWLRFQVLESVLKTHEKTDSNLNFNSLNLENLSFPAADTEERLNALPPIYVNRAVDGTVSEIRRSKNDSAAQVQMSAELLEEFLFRLGSQSDYTAQESTLQGSQSSKYQLRRSETSNAAIVISREVVNAKIGPSETRSQKTQILVDSAGTIAAVSSAATYTNIDEQPTDDWAMPTDNRDRIETSSLSTKARSDLTAELEGVYSVDQSVVSQSVTAINSGGLVSETLDEATTVAYEEQIKDDGADELMDRALSELNRVPSDAATLHLMVMAADAAPQRSGELVTAAASSTREGAAAVAAALAAAAHEPQAEAALATMITGNHGMNRAQRVGALMSASTVPKPTSVLVNAARTFTINETNQTNKAAITAAVHTPVLVWGALVDRSNYGKNQFDSYVRGRLVSGSPDEIQALKTAASNAGSAVFSTQIPNNARVLSTDRPTLGELFGDEGINWSYSAGTDFASADMGAKLGRFDEGDGGIWLGGKAHLNTTYKDKTTKVFDFSLYTGLDLTDEKAANNINAWGTEFGQIEREFVFQFTAFDSPIVDERRALACGLGASGDLLENLKNKKGEPLLQWSPKPFDKSFQIGPVTVSVIAQISAGLLAPWSLSADFCDALLATTTYYDPDVKKANGDVWPDSYEGQPAAAIGQVAFSLGIGGKLEGSVGAAVGLPVLRGGVELSGTLFAIQIPIGVSAQIMDKGNATHILARDEDGDLSYSFANFEPVVQVCWQGNIHTTVLKMSLYAFLEWRLPPIFNKWRRLWEGKVPKTGELFEVETKPIPIFNSKCSPVAARPLTIVSGTQEEGRHDGPRHDGTSIGQPQKGGNLIGPALDWFCQQKGFPSGHRNFTEADTVSAVTYLAGGTWTVLGRNNGHISEEDGTVYNQHVKTVYCLLGSGGDSGQIGMCLSANSNNWTLVFAGVDGAHVNLNTGKVTPGPGDAGVDFSANTWYRACRDTSSRGNARMAPKLNKEKTNKPETLSRVFSYMGVTTHQGCIDALVDTPGNFKLEDCGQFVSGAPQIAVSVQLTEQGKQSPSGSTAASPGPNVEPGTHKLRVSLVNEGVFDLLSSTVASGEGVSLSCPGGKIAAGATMICNGTVVANNDGAISHKIDVAGNYATPGADDPTAYSSSADWYFTNVGVKAGALAVQLVIDGTTVQPGVGTYSSPVQVLDEMVTVQWFVRNNTGRELTNVQMRVTGNLAGDNKSGLCKLTNIANGSSGKCEASYAAYELSTTPSLLSSTVSLQATEGQLVEDVTAYVAIGSEGNDPARLQVGQITTKAVSGDASVSHEVTAEIFNIGGTGLSGLKVTSSPLAELSCDKTSIGPSDKATCVLRFRLASYQPGQQVTLRATATNLGATTKNWNLPTASGLRITGVSINGFDGSLAEPNPIRRGEYNAVGLKIFNPFSSGVSLTFPNNIQLSPSSEIHPQTNSMECEGNRGPRQINVPARRSVECVVDVWLYDNAETGLLTATVDVDGQPSTVDIDFVRAPTALVIMGDSFASGEGGRWSGNSESIGADREGTDRAARYNGGRWIYNTSPIYGDTDVDGANICHRSDVGDLHFTAKVETRVNLACSGAETKDVRDDVALSLYNQRQDGSSQVTRLRETMQTSDVEMIVMSISGNDLDFGPVITRCVEAYVKFQGECRHVEQAFLDAQMDTAMNNLQATILNVQEAMEDAGDRDYRLVIQGNPSPIPRTLRPSYRPTRIDSGCPFYSADAAWARDDVTAFLGSNMKRVALANNAEFLNLGNLLEGREVCSPSAAAGSGPNAEWARFVGLGITQGDKEESMHPNALGQEAIANCINAMFDRMIGSYRCDNKPGMGPSNIVLRNDW